MSWWKKRSSFAAGALVLALLYARSAAAQSPRDLAKQHFVTGVELFGRGDLTHALADFQESYRLHAVPAVLFNIALAQKGLHQTVDAVYTLERFLREAAAHQGGLPAKVRADAEQALADLRAQVGAISLSTMPSSASVLIDDQLVDRAHAVYVMPGVHRLEVAAPGYLAQRRSVDLVAGNEATFRIELELTRAAPEPVVAETTPAPEPATLPPALTLDRRATPPSFVRSTRGQATIALGATSIGIWLTAAALGGSSISTHHDYTHSCAAPQTCNDSLYVRGHAMAVTADTFFGLGAATAAAALLVALVPRPPRAWALVPAAGPSQGALVLSGSF